MKVIGVIPARYKSVRLPGKPLALIHGKPMVQWVYEKAAAAKSLDEVIVATDDIKIMRAVWSFGGKAVLTSKSARSGTDRVAETVRKMAADVVVNIQGDEPMVSPKSIDAVVEPFYQDKNLQMATVATFSDNPLDAQSPNVVKVILNEKGNAIYFSRSPIPFYRDEKNFKGYYHHCGLYAYRKKFVLKMASWKQTPLEIAESLEQLRVLENGVDIRVVVVKNGSVGVDTPSDLEKIKELMR